MSRKPSESHTVHSLLYLFLWPDNKGTNTLRHNNTSHTMFSSSIGGAVFVNIVFMMLMSQPQFAIDVAPCFVLPAKRSLAFYITMDYNRCALPYRRIL
jgi:hypothetical protein